MNIIELITTTGGCFVASLTGCWVAIKFIVRDISQVRESVMRAHYRMDKHINEHAKNKV